MLIATWIRNRFLMRLKRQLLNITPTGSGERNTNARICFVAATRSTEEEFWKESPLATWLKPLLRDKNISANIRFTNRAGLPDVYNNAIQTEAEADILVFLHDDLWLDDPEFIKKIRIALNHFDVVGIAGNTRRVKHQPAWLFRTIEKGNFVWDHGHLSGSVLHGTPQHSESSYYGPTPASCKLLDGVFLAAKRKTLIQSRVHFDSRFNFHFYDMDFCRTACRAGLSLGTWPMGLLHLSAGAFGTTAWQQGHAIYKQKWKQ